MDLGERQERLTAGEMVQMQRAVRYPDAGTGTGIHSAYPRTDSPDDSDRIICYLDSYAEGESWEKGHVYEEGDIIQGTDTYPYRCTAQHESTDDDRPTTGVNWATCWESPVWVVSTQYNLGDLVLGTLTWVVGKVYQIGDKITGTDSNLYRCIVVHVSTNDNKPITGIDPGWETCWETLEWIIDTVYDIGQEVKGTNGLYYRCLASHTATANKRPITGAFWDSWWEPFYLDFYIYRCIRAHVSAADDQPICGVNWPTDWEILPTIVVSCILFGGGYLETASPSLKKRDEILVYQKDGNWRCLWPYVGVVLCDEET